MEGVRGGRERGGNEERRETGAGRGGRTAHTSVRTASKAVLEDTQTSTPSAVGLTRALYASRYLGPRTKWQSEPAATDWDTAVRGEQSWHGAADSAGEKLKRVRKAASKRNRGHKYQKTDEDNVFVWSRVYKFQNGFAVFARRHKKKEEFLFKYKTRSQGHSIEVKAYSTCACAEKPGVRSTTRSAVRTIGRAQGIGGGRLGPTQGQCHFRKVGPSTPSIMVALSQIASGSESAT